MPRGSQSERFAAENLHTPSDFPHSDRAFRQPLGLRRKPFASMVQLTKVTEGNPVPEALIGVEELIANRIATERARLEKESGLA
jgi:hypothetical protein